MTVGEAITYIEDIVDKYSSKYYEPEEILNRIERETYVVLETAIKEDSLKVDLNWEIANLFIDTITLSNEKTIYSEDWLKVVEGFNIIDGDEMPCRRRKSFNRSRNPFIAPTDEYPEIIDVSGHINIKPFITYVAENAPIKESGSFVNILTRPSFGSTSGETLIYKVVDATNVEANQSLIDRVLSNTVVSLTGSQNNQTMQYEWAKLNKQENAQEGRSATARPQQQ